MLSYSRTTSFGELKFTRVERKQERCKRKRAVHDRLGPGRRRGGTNRMKRRKGGERLPYWRSQIKGLPLNSGWDFSKDFLEENFDRVKRFPSGYWRDRVAENSSEVFSHDAEEWRRRSGGGENEELRGCARVAIAYKARHKKYYSKFLLGLLRAESASRECDGVLEISSVPVYFVHGPFNSQMHRRFSATDIFVPFRVPIAWLPVAVLVFWPVSSRSRSCIY